MSVERSAGASRLYREYPVWDLPTRLFHWINALSVLGLMATALVILNGSSLGLAPPGKILMKSVHVMLGYVMTVNLLWRLLWAFIGTRHARWGAILPGGPGYLAHVRAYASAFWSGRPQQYVGHNPLGRLAITAILALLAVQAVTGLVLAGTDLFWPPFGGSIAAWVAAPGVDPASLQPGMTELVDKAAYQAMREFRAPFVETHELTFIAVAIIVVLHIAAVVVTEVREGGSITSAMFTGRKLLDRPPADEPPPGR